MILTTVTPNIMPSGTKIDNYPPSSALDLTATLGKRKRSISIDSSSLSDESTSPPPPLRQRQSHSDDNCKSFPKRTPLTKRDANWEERFNQLVEYKQKHNTTRVLKSNTKLFAWIHTQRTMYKQKKLSEYRFQKLSALGFDWKLLSFLPWIDMYNELLEYKKNHNGCTNVAKTSLTHDKLGRWVYHQRSLYRNDKLSSERIELLQSIGFKWRIVDDTPWEDMYKRLILYKQEHGTTCVPYKYEADRKLGRWVYAQRRSCDNQDFVDRLNNIGFVWDARGRNQHASY